MGKVFNITNNTSDKGFFKAFIPITEKNGKTCIIEKEFNGVKRKFLTGIATNTQVDKEDERMSKSFISKIKQACLGLNVFVEHEHSIDKTIGYVDEVGGDENNLEISVALEDESDNELVKRIIKKSEHGTKIGFSIGGKISKAKKCFDEKMNKWINEIEDGEIYEISATAIPAGNGTWANIISKSLKDLINSDEIKKQLNSVSNSTESMDELSKALDEMIESNELRNKMWDMFWAYKESLYSILESDSMTPQQKGDKIKLLSDEFAMKVEELSSLIYELSVTVTEQLGITIED